MGQRDDHILRCYSEDTVVAGNLYVTAGVELGDVVLENVKVLGEIVVSGGGVSEAGEDSVILRNVDAPKLVVDNIKTSRSPSGWREMA